MAYIGQSIKNGTFSVLDTSGNTYNGSNTTFSLGTQVGSAAQLLVSHDGVVQKPGTDYTLASGGTQITFTTAPASGASIFIVEISGAVGGPMNRDINGDELILDVDGDTSITADTDDQIDVKIGGTDQFSIKDGVIEPTTDNDVDIGSSSKEFKDGYFDGTLHCDVLDLAGTEHTSITGGVTLVKSVLVTSTSTYTPTSGTKFVTVYATGGGGGGGGVNPNGESAGGGAGGGGGTCIVTYNATELGNDAAISIGSGGAGGSGTSAGSSGGNTTVNPAGTGGTITANGGGGGKGVNGNSTRRGASGSGGGFSGGLTGISGAPGHARNEGDNDTTTNKTQATGGASYFQHASISTLSSGANSAGTAGTRGCGGNGAFSANATGSNISGGAGGDGLVLISEFA
jgi:hypothetical protein